MNFEKGNEEKHSTGKTSTQVTHTLEIYDPNRHQKLNVNE